MHSLSSFLTRCALVVLLCAAAYGQQKQSIALPPAETEGGKPLMQALKARTSQREFRTEKLSPQALSNLLWAGFGVNRTDSGNRTAPSASNRQEIEIYVATEDGLYVYNATGHALDAVLSADIRQATGRQEWVRTAPVNLVYVADFSKMGDRATTEDKILYSAADTGFISQNVYLFCASEGLATVVRGGIDRTALASAMKLRPDQRIILAQTVGYPKK